MMFAVLALLQASLPTVGDTIWLTRTLEVPAGYAVRPPPWSPTGPIELLGKPTLTIEGTTATLHYPAVAWEPGIHRVVLPGPILLGPHGETDSLVPQTDTVEVASVLPPNIPDSALRIQPQAGLVPRGSLSYLPLLVFWGLAAVLLTPLILWWRRGPRRIDSPSVAGPPAVPVPPVERWAEAGEERAVAAAAVAELRTAIALKVPEAHPALDAEACIGLLAAARPTWPMDDIAKVIRLLESARFAPVVASEAAALHRRVADLARTIAAEPS